ncbi:MAG: hypothetical protein ABIV43_01380 [Candidatus Saccharimonadales bacterium]
MRAINHALSGAIIGLSVGQPLLAAPLAFASHYVLDVIPHHGAADGNDALGRRSFAVGLIVDALLCAILVLILAVRQPLNWPLAAVCAFLAASPDLFSFNRYWKTIHNQPFKAGRYSEFAHKIQWFERPIGAIVELAWLIAAVVIISPYLR